MIFGVGCDIIEIERFSHMDELFLEKHFTEKERELFRKKKYPEETIAANFAAKEAFSKAVGTGVRGFSLCEVEVLRDDLGKPYINVYGKAEELLRKLGIKHLSLSLSHSKELAMAYVIAE